MRKILVSNLMSLDGFFEGPNGNLDWFVTDEEFFEYARKLLCSVDTLLFGRKTYEPMAAYWPNAPRDEIADKMNGLAKFVFSNTLRSTDWSHSQLLRGDPAPEVARMKQTVGGDMVIFGSAMLASSLLRAKLIDEYRVILCPVLIGKGNPLFQSEKEKLKLHLLGTHALGSGVVILSYGST
jgi:dihydrofolate reductase